MVDDILIIGGGIAGLYTAWKLHQRGYSVRLFEKHAEFGGRIKSKYKDKDKDKGKEKDKNKDKEMLYETGPWRIHESHTRLLDLLKTLELPIHSISKKKEYKDFPITSGKKSFKKKSEIKVQPMDVTMFQEECIRSSVEAANESMQKSGYDMHFQEAFRKESKSMYQSSEGAYFVMDDGFSTLVKTLVNILSEQSNVTMCLQHFVQNIDYDPKSKIYKVEYTVRKKTHYVSYSTSARHVILAIPPLDLQRFKSLTLHPNIATVGTLPLLHTMAYSEKISKNFGKYVCNSPISQIICSCFDNNWFQISYTSGRMAMLFHNLYLSSKREWRKYLLSEFYKYFPKSITVSKIIPYFWRNAVHYWHPNYKTNANTLEKRNINPHPQKYPNLYMVGESISTVQGWIEGALQTVDILLDGEFSMTKKKLPKEYVIYDNRIINVEKWKTVHPGSQIVIENHMFEDITQLWNQYHPFSASKYFVALEHRN